ncbi:MAG: hypothetical protein K0R28_90 [Paenibacillus sp.]|nr:hypothetical protein [Paenibacillus sp.]
MACSERWKIVLFGSMGVAVECMEWLITRPEFDVIGVVCSREGRSKWREAVNDRDMREVAPGLGVPLLTLDDVLLLQADVGLSVRFHQILQESHLDRFRLGCVNFHGAPLPEIRGAMGNIMAVLSGYDYFGASLHWMDRGIDTGDLLAVERFRIFKTDTVYDLFKRCNLVGLQMIKTHLLDIVEGKLRAEPQSIVAERMNRIPETFNKKQAMKYKRIEPNMSPERLWDVVRAFQFPGQEPAYMETAAGRIYFSIGEAGDAQDHQADGGCL